MRTIDIGIVLAYLAGTCVLGARMGRRERSGDEYFLAGRRMPWFLVGISILATMLSTITYLSLPGEVIKYGLGFLCVLFAYPLVYPVFAYVCIPQLFRLPATSVYEYLETRYDHSVRTAVALVFLATRVTWVAGIVYTSAFALAGITGVSIYAYVLLIGVSTTYYTTHGGVRGVIWTDAAQFFLLFGGALLMPLYVFAKTGAGIAAWWSQFAEAGHLRVQVFSWDPAVRLTVVGAILQRFFFTICTHSADQVAAQRYFTTPSADKARRSFLTYLVSSAATSLLLALCGLSLFSFYRARSPLSTSQFRQQVAERADQLLPTFIAQELPVGLAGLMVAAVLAAGMSSLSSGINSLSAVALVDFVERMPIGSAAVLRNHKALSALIGLGITGAALGYCAVVQGMRWNLLEANLRLGTVLTGPMAVPFLAGILFRSPGARAALFGLLTSSATGIALAFGKGVVIPGKEISFLWIVPAATTVGLILTAGAGSLARAAARTRQA